MTPFQEFRLWVRRAPAGELVSAAVAVAVELAVLAWIVVPEAGTKGSQDNSFGVASSQNASPGGPSGPSSALPASGPGAGGPAAVAAGGSVGNSTGGRVTGSAGAAGGVAGRAGGC